MGRGDSYQLQHQGGGKVLAAGDSFAAAADNDGHAGREMVVLTDAVLATYTSNLSDASTDIAGATLPAGTVIGGVISAVSVTSGLVVVYF